MFKIDKLSANYLEKPMAFTELPNLSWVLSSNLKAVEQSAFRIQVSTDASFEDLLCDSGKTPSSQSVHVPVPDFHMQSTTRYYARVKAWNNYEEETLWSHPVSWLSGVLTTSEWNADFISAESPEDAASARGTYVRKEIAIAKEISQAYCYTTALGLYHFYINGRKVSDDQLTPGWTSYNNRLLYQSYDVTSYLNNGQNMLGAHLGAGWYKGTMGFKGKRNIYGDRTAFLCQLYIQYSDGSAEYIITNKTWEGSTSPVLFSEMYDGEKYDARLEQPGWNQPGASSRNWQPVNLIEKDKSILTVQEGCTIKEIDELPVKNIFQTPQGDTVVDFGQNMSGWVKFTATGKKDEVIQFHYFETLDNDGNVYLDNLRTAKSMLTYTCKDEQQVSYKPSFCFHGFRYLKLDAFPAGAGPDNFKAYAVHSDMEPTGTFSCSNPYLNQLQHNILWGLKGNFLDIPTDCPQRDERLGWTGDAQIFSSTATYLMNTYTFFSKWLQDLAAEQAPNGGVPHVVPDVLTDREETDWHLSQGTHSAAAWSDAAVINPWVLYLKYGDTAIIEQQYDSMKGWIDFMTSHSENGTWHYALQYGDWVALDAEEGSYIGATSEDLICSAYYAYSTRLFAQMANAVGKADDYNNYYSLSEEIRLAFGRKYFREDGSMTVQTQTAHILALHFNLVPDVYLEKTAHRLTELLAAENGHLVTGFVGTPYFCFALSQNRYVKEAYELLMKDDFPSWLYQVKKGATTIWEHWDGLKEDGSMWDADMNSFNHYAYGAIGDWMYRTIAGIEADEDCPGYKHTIIRPQIGGGLTQATGSYQSVYGTICSSWRVDENIVTLKIEIPVNTTATIYLDQACEVSSEDISGFIQTDDTFYTSAGSGSYTIQYKLQE